MTVGELLIDYFVVVCLCFGYFDFVNYGLLSEEYFVGLKGVWYGLSCL